MNVSGDRYHCHLPASEWRQYLAVPFAFELLLWPAGGPCGSFRGKKTFLTLAIAVGSSEMAPHQASAKVSTGR